MAIHELSVDYDAAADPGAKGNLDEVISEISSYINLAVKLKTPFIRILGDREPMPVDEVVAKISLENKERV